MRRRRERGVVLVIALAILTGLVAFVTAVAASQRLALRAEENRINAQKARVAAQAGLQRALAALAQTIQDTTNATPSTSSNGTTIQGQAQMQTDEWYTLGTKGDERFTVGGGSFRLEIVDAGGLVNLNTAPEQQLATLPLTTEQVAAILDWREQSTTPRTEGGKDEFYNALEKPYNAKLRRFDSVDELLDVRYFTPPDLYQVNDNTNSTVVLPPLTDGRDPVLVDLLTVDSFAPQLRPDGTAMINVSTQVQANRLTDFGNDAQAIAQNSPYTNLGDIFARVSQQNYGNVLDILTVKQGNRVEGLINLNTASEAVLMTIPNMTQDLAQGIVNYQSTGFTKLSDLLQVSGFNDANNLRQFAGYFTVRSSVFLVRIVGEANGTQIAIEAVVDTSTGTPRIIKMHDQPFSDMPSRWGWPTDPQNETSLVESR